MAEYVPVHEDHYIERDTGAGSGFWAVLAVILVLLVLLLFGSRIFGTNRGTSNGGTNINGSGTVNTPSGTYQGSGTVR
jgi:hypothetical protein